MVDPAVQTVWLIKLIPCEKQHWLSLSNCKSFSIFWGRASRVLLIALEVMNQGCLERPTQAHIPENIRDDGLVSRLLGSARVAFLELLPFAHKAEMKPQRIHVPTSALLPALSWDACKIATRADGAGTCVSTSTNNKTSSPHICMQLIHPPNHGSLKISANWERALQCMICPRPHRKPVAKLETEPKAPGSRIGFWPWAWGHPGTLPLAVPGRSRQGDTGLTKAPCLHVFKPRWVVGCPCSRCSVNLEHHQESVLETRPHESQAKSCPSVEAFDLYFLHQLACVTHAADKERDIWYVLRGRCWAQQSSSCRRQGCFPGVNCPMVIKWLTRGWEGKK